MWFCLFPVKHPCFISTGETWRESKKEKVSLLLMDFAVVHLTSISIPSRPGFLCSFSVHGNAFSSYTIFMTDYWPFRSWTPDRNLIFLPLEVFLKQTRQGRAPSLKILILTWINAQWKQLIEMNIFPVEGRENQRIRIKQNSNHGYDLWRTKHSVWRV